MSQSSVASPVVGPVEAAKPMEWKLLLWIASFGLLLYVLDGGPLGKLRGPKEAVSDFVQEWLSAKFYLDGKPVYSPLSDGVGVSGLHKSDEMNMKLKWNAHPPVAVLFALPFATLDYRSAQLVWNLLQFPLLGLSVYLVIRELGGRFVWQRHLFPGLCALMVCYPLVSTIEQGQLNFLLLALIVGAWSAHRNKRDGLAGGLLGTAAAVKLFPAFLVLYFVLQRRWVSVAGSLLVFLLWNMAALLLFGSEAFNSYIQEVIPSLTVFQSEWQNLTPAAVWQRLFAPHPDQPITPLMPLTLFAFALVWITRALIFVWVIRGVLRFREAEPDRAFSLAILGMVLLGPITWSHSLVLLWLPVALMWWQLPVGRPRRAFWWVVAVLWLPNYYILLLLGIERFGQITTRKLPNLQPLEGGLLALPAVALLGLFVLALTYQEKRTT